MEFRYNYKTDLLVIQELLQLLEIGRSKGLNKCEIHDGIIIDYSYSWSSSSFYQITKLSMFEMKIKSDQKPDSSWKQNENEKYYLMPNLQIYYNFRRLKLIKW